MRVFKFAAGLAVGYVLGSRAGRDKYDQIVAAARQAQNHPAVTQLQQKAKDLLGTANATPPTADVPSPPLEAATATTAADPIPRPSRRQPKNTVPVPGTSADL